MSKLTLTVDPEVVQQAKLYAASQKQSLSKLVENYLKNISNTVAPKTPPLTGITAELAGIIDANDIPEKGSYTDHLEEKYQ